jgi:hypothetical protein
MRRLGKTVLLAGAVLAAGCLTMACALVATGTVASPWAGRSVVASSVHRDAASSVHRDGAAASSVHCHGAVAHSRPSGGTVLAAAAQPSDTPTPVTPTAVPTTPTAVPTTPTAVPTTPTAVPTTPSSASPTPSPTSTGSGGAFSGDLIWLWVILGALVLLGIILLATRSPGRSSGGTPVTTRPPPMPTSGWHAKVTEAYSEGAALDHAVRAVARQDAFADAALFADLQRRIYHLTETLYGMRDTAPTETRRAQVVNALLTLEAVTDLVNARRTPGGANSPQGMGVNARLAAMESALNDLRVPEQPVL